MATMPASTRPNPKSISFGESSDDIVIEPLDKIGDKKIIPAINEISPPKRQTQPSEFAALGCCSAASSCLSVSALPVSVGLDIAVSQIKEGELSAAGQRLTVYNSSTEGQLRKPLLPVDRVTAVSSVVSGRCCSKLPLKLTPRKSLLSADSVEKLVIEAAIVVAISSIRVL